jgi:hypothetical protein
VTVISSRSAHERHIGCKGARMRRKLFWLGWIVLFVLPVIYGIQIYVSQDLPPVEAWKWIIPIAAVLLIVLARDKDDVLKHHVV